MATFMKHRDETEIFEVDLARRLSSGETIQAVQAVQVARNTGMDWENVTDNFVDTERTSVLQNRIVQFALRAAAPDRLQPVGEYVVTVKVSTSAQRILLATNPLFITRVGGIA